MEGRGPYPHPRDEPRAIPRAKHPHGVICINAIPKVFPAGTFEGAGGSPGQVPEDGCIMACGLE
jgi:hypothetical protein